LYEVGEVERLAEDEKAGIEGVAHLQLGILRVDVWRHHGIGRQWISGSRPSCRSLGTATRSLGCCCASHPLRQCSPIAVSKWWDSWFVEEVEWSMNTMLHPMIREAQEGKEYREVLLTKLSGTMAEMKTMSQEMSCLYSTDSHEWMTFVSTTAGYQQERLKYAMEQINGNCKSYQGRCAVNRWG